MKHIKNYLRKKLRDKDGSRVNSFIRGKGIMTISGLIELTNKHFIID